MWNVHFLNHYPVPNIPYPTWKNPAKFRSSAVLSFYPLPPNSRLPQRQPSSLGFHSHERCFISIDEAEMVGGGCTAPVPPPGCVRLPYLFFKYQEGGGEGGPLPPFPLLLAPPPPAQTKRGRPTYRSRSASETLPHTRPRCPHLFVEISVLTA